MKQKPRTSQHATTRGAQHRKRRAAVVIDSGATPSVYARKAVRVFSEGVQDAYAKLAKRHVATVVVVGGKLIRGVPRRVAGRYVVIEAPKASLSG